MPHKRIPVVAVVFVLTVLLARTAQAADERLQEAEMAGYLLVPHGQVPETYDAGFSMYVAAWPLLKDYPGHRFQTGLFGTWMFARFPEPKPKDLYSDIEGGLGWWRDTRFATVTPKFIMGGVAMNFSEWANGPGAGKGRDWNNPTGLYGVAQLSPWVLWPPDGLNLQQGTCGELVGYGYLPLPLTKSKLTTKGKDVPTGDHAWTLFLNTQNFKGPVAFFTPYFWSRASVEDPKLAGMFLDNRPSDPNRAIQMETQYVPSFQAVDSAGDVFARIAPTSFPRNSADDSIVVHRVTAYNKSALWDSVKQWFEGGDACDGSIDPQGAMVHSFRSEGRSTWRIYPPDTTRKDRVSIAWNTFAKPVALDEYTYGYRWDFEHVTKTDHGSGPLATLPEYFRLSKRDSNSEWVVVSPTEVPAETTLSSVNFGTPNEEAPEPYVTPDDLSSVWKSPGPAAGPFEAQLGDGSVVTYFWYRFADQPALLNADLTNEERQQIQQRVEKLHRTWKKENEYLAPPSVGQLASIDPALLVTPPAGLEIGYVPIVTRQGRSEANHDK